MQQGDWRDPRPDGRISGAESALGSDRGRTALDNSLLDHIIRLRRRATARPPITTPPRSGSGAGPRPSWGPGLFMRPTSAFALLASSCLLMGFACDSLRLPPPPGKAVATASDTHSKTTATAAKPNRTAKLAVTPDPALDGPRFEQIRRGLRRLVVAEE